MFPARKPRPLGTSGLQAGEHVRTSAYLHARPDRSSAYVLDAGIVSKD